MKKLLSAFFILFVLSVNVSGKVLSDYSSLRHLGVEVGLSNLLVTDIEKDNQGFIWVATEAGLGLFDGDEFRTFSKSNSALVGDALNTLLFDKRENSLWVGTKTGVSKMDRSTMEFACVSELDSLDITNVVSFSFNPEGDIWVADHYDCVALCDARSGKVLTYINMEERNLPSSFRFVMDNQEGLLYMGHEGEGFGIFDLNKQTYRGYRHDASDPYSLPGDDVFCCCVDRAGHLWLGTNKGLALYRPETDDFLNFHHDPANPYSLVSDIIYDICEMSDGTLWIASDIGGVNILDLRNIAFLHPDEVHFRSIDVTYDERGLSSGNIRSLLEDAYGNIWIGNRSSGVDFVSHKQQPFSILPYRKRGQTIKLENVIGICSDGKNGVWLGGMNEIAYFQNGEEKKRIDLTSSLTRSYAQVSALYCDGDELYVGTYDDGILKICLSNGKVERLLFSENEEGMSVYSFYKDPEGIIWAGTVHGLYYWDKTRRMVCPEKEVNKIIKGVSVFGILRDSQGKLWVGTYGDGIYVFNDEKKRLFHLCDKNGLISNTIHQFSFDGDRRGVWVALRGGIARIPDTLVPEEFICYDSRNELNDVYVHALVEDWQHNLWFSTDRGISCYRKQEKKFYHFDYSYGIPKGSFSDAGVSITQDSIFYFASQNGVCYFHPEDIRQTEKVSPIRIVDCRVMYGSGDSFKDKIFIPKDGKIQLSYQQNSFSIRFSVSDYAQNRQVEYAYRMEGGDMGNEWVYLKGDNRVTFRDIVPGNYTFCVKARLHNQEWEDGQMSTLSVEVFPPFWKTWYAKTFYVCVVLIMIYCAFRFYRHKLLLENSLEMEQREMQNEQRLNNERLHFYTNVTHELRTPLTLIIGPLQDLVEDPKFPSSYVHKVRIIHQSAVRLLELINQILEFRKTETQNKKLTVAKGNLQDLVMEIGLRYKELNRNDKVQVEIHIETEQTCLYFDVDVVTTILNNLLSNALKYTPQGKICLTLRTVGEYTEMEVSDTGYGIGSEALPHIFERYYQAEGKHQASGSGIGLALVKSLADLHEGVLRASSELDKGTTIVFSLRTDNIYPDALHKDVPVNKSALKEESALSSIEQNAELPLVLVVEDNDDIRDYIAVSFRNYRVVTATNGQEGWEKAQTDIPDIIVSDIMMPVMDGIELCRLVKKDMRTSHIPVILLTAKDAIRDKEEGYESGADSYLTKPFSAKLLESRVRNLLELRRRMACLISKQGKMAKQEKDTDNVHLNKLDKEFLDNLTVIIESNIDSEKLDMSFIADQMHMSHSTLYRKIKGLTGTSGNEFIRKVKLRHSLTLMLEEGYNVSEAAYASGFSDLGYFRTCFKEEYGKTPSDYVKQQKE